MKIHEEILTTVRRLCSARRSWTFTPAEVVQALPHLNERSVRTHIVSRCCVNAPTQHAHRLPYFKRLRRGVYEVLKDYANRDPIASQAPEFGSFRVAETEPPTDRVLPPLDP